MGNFFYSGLKISSILLVFLTTFSCSIQKRNYRPGYHITWNYTKKHHTNTNNRDFSEEIQKNESLELATVFQSENPITAHIEKNPLLPVKKTVRWNPDTCGDVIFMHDGRIVSAKVIEVNDEKIKYKRCDNLDGPTIVTSVNKVNTIKYANGSSQTFESVPAAPSQTNYPAAKPPYTGPQKTHRLAISAFVFAILAIPFALFFIPSIIMANNAIRAITEEPTKYKGLALAKAARIISLIIFLIVLFFIIVLVIL